MLKHDNQRHKMMLKHDSQRFKIMYIYHLRLTRGNVQA